MSERRGPGELLTRPGWAVTGGSLAALSIGAAVGVVEVIALGGIGLALVAVCLAWVILRRPVIEVRRRVVPPRCQAGAVARVELTITNSGRTRSPAATLHDPVSSTVGARLDIGSLLPRAHASTAYRLPTQRRGRFEIGPMSVAVADPFGIARRERTVGGTATTTVLPHIDRISARLPGEGRDDLPGPPRPQLLGQGREFAGLRPYVRGDDLRRVHWRSSARASDLLVRQDEPPAAGRVTVLVDVRTSAVPPAAQEHVVSAAASILSACSDRGDAVRLVTSDGADSGAGSTAHHLDDVLDRLAVLEPHYSSSLAPALTTLRLRPTDALVVVTAAMAPDDLVALAAAARHASLVRFEPSSWPQGAGAGLPLTWDGGNAATDADVPAPPHAFGTVIRCTEARPFPAAWRLAR